jgi:hypothetical protein
MGFLYSNSSGVIFSSITSNDLSHIIINIHVGVGVGVGVG